MDKERELDYPRDPIDMLELCLMLVESQLRDKQINSFTELDGFRVQITDTLSMIKEGMYVDRVSGETFTDLWYESKD